MTERTPQSLQERTTQLIREGELIGTAIIRARREFGLPVTGPARVFEIRAAIQRERDRRIARQDDAGL